MAPLLERIETDYRTAFKAGERLRTDTMRLIKAGIQRVASEKRKDALTDQEILQVIVQQAKQRRETMDAAKNTTRQDVFTQASQELAILNAYLPQPLSEDALKQFVEEAIQAVGTNQGQIMKHVMAKAAGAADGKLVSQLVAARLKVL